jgi:hypothetical protein
MATLDLLLQQHRDLLTLGKELGAFLDSEAPVLSELARVRWQISSLVGRHLAAQDEVMRSLARLGLKPRERAIFDQYFADLLDMRLAFANHNCAWTLEAVQADWRGYGVAVREQIVGLSNRIDWEEQVLFPVLRALEANAIALASGDARSAA